MKSQNLALLTVVYAVMGLSWSAHALSRPVHTIETDCMSLSDALDAVSEYHNVVSHISNTYGTDATPLATKLSIQIQGDLDLPLSHWTSGNNMLTQLETRVSYALKTVHSGPHDDEVPSVELDFATHGPADPFVVKGAESMELYNAIPTVQVYEASVTSISTRCGAEWAPQAAKLSSQLQADLKLDPSHWSSGAAFLHQLEYRVNYVKENMTPGRYDVGVADVVLENKAAAFFSGVEMEPVRRLVVGDSISVGSASGPCNCVCSGVQDSGTCEAYQQMFQRERAICDPDGRACNANAYAELLDADVCAMAGALSWQSEVQTCTGKFDQYSEIIVYLGTNDILMAKTIADDPVQSQWFGHSVQEVLTHEAGELRKIVEAAGGSAKSPAVKVLLANPPNGMVDNTAWWNTEVEAMCGNVAEAYPNVSCTGPVNLTPEEIDPNDHVHPNAAGMCKMAQYLDPQVQC